jgi:gamma-glutamyltranspeptidase / glutathione hydrolase
MRPTRVTMKFPWMYLLSEEWGEKMLAILPAAAVAEPVEVISLPETVQEPGNTTHLSIIDGAGNVVSLTQTINSFFGSGVMVPGTGIMLNNELYDFTLREGSANFPAPGKKPRSSMSPTIIVGPDQIAALGTPGGCEFLPRCFRFSCARWTTANRWSRPSTPRVCTSIPSASA